MRTLVIEIIDGISIEGFIRSTAVGAEIAAQLRALGAQGAVSWMVDGGALPDGWTLDADTGLVAGTADDPGDYAVTICATDSAGRYVRRPFAWRVAYLPLSISGTVGDDWVVGGAVSGGLTLSGGSGVYASLAVLSGEWPAGVGASIVGNEIFPTGTPTTAGAWSISLRVTDSLGATADVVVSGTVAAAPISITGTPLAAAEVGVPYSHLLYASGGTTPRVLSTMTGLPSGLSGVLTDASAPTSIITLSGTPASGTVDSSPFALGIGVTDAAAGAASITPSLVVDGDIYAAHVVALLRLNGSNGGTSFPDVTGRTWTAHGNAQTSTAQSVFGGSSMLLDGTDDYLWAASASALNLWPNDFCIEVFFRSANVTANKTVWYVGDANNNRAALFHLNGTIGLYTQTPTGGGGQRIVSGTILSSHTWYFATVSRVAGVSRLFAGPVSGGSASYIGQSSTTVGPNANCQAILGRTGNESAFDFNGYIGPARFTAHGRGFSANSAIAIPAQTFPLL